MPLTHHYNTITNIPESFALSRYIKKIFKVHKGVENFFNALSISTSAIPEGGGPVSMIIDKWLQERTASIDNMLLLYFQYIIKKTRINLIIDNYQFLPDNIKKVLEIGINKFTNGFSLVVIERIITVPNHERSFCSAYRHDFMDLEYMSYEQYESLVTNQHISITEEQKCKIWNITKGNLKDVEIILNELRVNPGYDIISNKLAIQQLDSIQRSILLITALFPAGMKENLVIEFIRSILSETEEKKIKNAITYLINLGYIYINSSSHDTIKPTHETVINHVREAVSVDDFMYFCSRLSDSIEELAEYHYGTRDYSYLLHCWVGINTAEKLKKKSSLVQELISIKYKENEYYYIDMIANSIIEIIIYLPISCIEKILISFQRVSDFHKGINLLNNIRQINSSIYDRLQS